MAGAGDMRRFFGQYGIARHGAMADDGNPLHVWRAYRVARKSGEPIPAFVLAYLDGAAAEFANNDTVTAKVAAEILGFATKGGGRGPGRLAKARSDRLGAAQQVWAIRKMFPDRNVTEIFGAVAEARGVSFEYVRDACSEFSTKPRK